MTDIGLALVIIVFGLPILAIEAVVIAGVVWLIFAIVAGRIRL
ncbi:hypothetical protein SAMN04488498_104354 [Mesorhizobium albiziae]|uniref:Uncharacterized protein n=1 Tax=Neomesorhizobium albiziae TaxID=335020 RepID=A0A1I3YEI2_9HYPH|nr:hypothetical protein [Mesorhizobium albiziae]GLS29941.1 hypothetical protein GCM10007937_16490 [Mesorhizobium albiziae]SFK29691.1 hypothetical protein SAMN04488498_104354 [Mesorhizobium albiziae]